MTIQLTEKHYALLIRVLEIMASFYGNDFASICKEAGETYGVGEDAIQEACSVLTAVNVTAPVPAMQETAERLLNIAKNPVILPKNQAPYTKQIDIEEDDMIRLVSMNIGCKQTMMRDGTAWESLRHVICLFPNSRRWALDGMEVLASPIWISLIIASSHTKCLKPWIMPADAAIRIAGR